MYTRSYSPPTPPPKNYGGTMYKAQDTEKNDSCEINTAEPPREISKSNTVQIGTEELLIIGLLLLLLYGGGERDAVLLISMVLLAGFV